MRPQILCLCIVLCAVARAADAPPPIITSASPNLIDAGGPYFLMTITGANFAAGASVNLASAALGTTFVSSTQLQAAITPEIRALSGTFNLTVTEPGGITSGALAIAIMTWQTLKIPNTQSATGMLYVGTQRLPFVITIGKPPPGQGSYDFIGRAQYVSGPRGLPLLKPPFGSIVAIDMNSGEHRWRIPVGRSEAMGSVKRLGVDGNWGLPFRSWALLTKTVMIVVQMGYNGPPRFVPGFNVPVRDLFNLDPHLWVYDKASGEMLAEIELPANATGSPMTYMAGGKQYIAFPVGGSNLIEELIAVSL